MLMHPIHTDGLSQSQEKKRRKKGGKLLTWICMYLGKAILYPP